jgi:hypothetical protein
LKKLLAEPLLGFILDWKLPEDYNAEGSSLEYHLSQIFRILADVSSHGNNAGLKEACIRNFKNSPVMPLSSLWLATLFRISGESAVDSLERVINEMNSYDRKAWIGKLFGGLFSPFDATAINCENDNELPDVLSKLCIIAYSNIIPEEDNDRSGDGAFTPDSRDKAQSARNYLLNSLINLKDLSGESKLEELAETPALDSVKEYITGRLRAQATEQVEFGAWSIEEIKSLEKSFERAPVDRQSIFNLMVNRLEDLQHDISHHDFFPRKTFQAIELEEEVQRMLAMLLEQNSRGLYSIVREDEAADGKITDIRMVANDSHVRAVIEVKIADRWTVKQLLRALDAQLSGQYLRHESCKVGCLLLTYAANKKKFWIDKTNGGSGRIHFDDLVTLLNKRANELTEQKGPDFHITVIGLDLRSPKLVPAHG